MIIIQEFCFGLVCFVTRYAFWTKMIIYDQRTSSFWRLMNRWFWRLMKVLSFFKKLHFPESHFQVMSKICLNRTSRYYIKTNVHSYFNIIKRSITLKCPTNLPHFSVITDQITKVITYHKLLHRWNIVTIEFHLSKLHVSNIRISGCH